MVERPQKITFAELRAAGHTEVQVFCRDHKCSHSVTLSADRWPDHLRLSDVERKYTCTACGKRGADLRPNFATWRDPHDRWARIFNKGYAGVFNHETPEDKKIVEISTAREWCQSVAAEFGIPVGEPELNPEEPPDCYVSIGGHRRSLELTQLLEARHKARSIKGESPDHGKLFLDMQWSEERFAKKLRECIEKKSRKYQSSARHIDVLVVHTDEKWLSPSQVREWLPAITIDPYPNVASAFLLLNHEPLKDVWPIFRLYGDLPWAEESGPGVPRSPGP